MPADPRSRLGAHARADAHAPGEPPVPGEGAESLRNPRLAFNADEADCCTCVGWCDRRGDGICRCLLERPTPDEAAVLLRALPEAPSKWTLWGRTDLQLLRSAKAKLAALAAASVEERPAGAPPHDDGNEPSAATSASVPDSSVEGAKAPHDGECCDVCGQPYDYVWWCHDPVLWESVTGHAKPAGDNAAGLMCIPCFDELAREYVPWIEWAPMNLRHLEYSAPTGPDPTDGPKEAK